MPTNIDQATAEKIVQDVTKFGDDVKALNDNVNRELHELREIVNTAKGEDAVLAEKIDKIATSVETKMTTLEGNLAAANENVEALTAKSKRPGGVGGGWSTEDEAKEAKAKFAWHKAKLANEGRLQHGVPIEPDMEAYAAYEEAFPSYIRARSDNALKQSVHAALQTGSDPDGGYLVPVTVDTRIIKKVYLTSNLRGIAHIATIGGKELIIPRDEGEFGTGGWVGETTAPAETTTSQVGESKIAVHEMYAEPRVTQNMLEDGAFDVEGWIADKVGAKFGRVEETAFFTGTGVNQPRGLLTYGNWTTPSVTENGAVEQIVSGNATQVTLDGLYDLIFALKAAYTPMARFLMKRVTIRDLLKLKDGDGKPIWQGGDIRTGQPATLLNYEISRAEDMAAVGAGALAIAFGDFEQSYTIVDRLGITLLRDNLTSKPYVKMYNRRRVGGDVVNFEAFKLQKISV